MVDATGTYHRFYRLAPLTAMDPGGGVEAAMKVVHKNVALANFYQRIRQRSSAKIARVTSRG